jgi:hypothetical protein
VYIFVIIIIIIIVTKCSYLTLSVSFTVSPCFFDPSFLGLCWVLFYVLSVQVAFLLLCVLGWSSLSLFVYKYDFKSIAGVPAGRELQATLLLRTARTRSSIPGRVSCVAGQINQTQNHMTKTRTNDTEGRVVGLHSDGVPRWVCGNRRPTYCLHDTRRRWPRFAHVQPCRQVDTRARSNTGVSASTLCDY